MKRVRVLALVAVLLLSVGLSAKSSETIGIDEIYLCDVPNTDFSFYWFTPDVEFHETIEQGFSELIFNDSFDLFVISVSVIDGRDLFKDLPSNEWLGYFRTIATMQKGDQYTLAHDLSLDYGRSVIETTELNRYENYFIDSAIVEGGRNGLDYNMMDAMIIRIDGNNIMRVNVTYSIDMFPDVGRVIMESFLK